MASSKQPERSCLAPDEKLERAAYVQIFAALSQANDSLPDRSGSNRPFSSDYTARPNPLYQPSTRALRCIRPSQNYTCRRDRSSKRPKTLLVLAKRIHSAARNARNQSRFGSWLHASKRTLAWPSSRERYWSAHGQRIRGTTSCGSRACALRSAKAILLKQRLLWLEVSSAAVAS